MLARLLAAAFRLLLLARYRVVVRGLDRIARRGTHGILFLPNHPALIDPLILMAHLLPRFRPRPLADQDQIDLPVVRTLARRIGVIPLPDIKIYGAAVRDQVEAAAATCGDALRTGSNVLVYPSGHIYRTHLEDLRGNSGVEALLRAAPDARVVLVRTRGLWGSSFSLIAGEYPNLARLAPRHIARLLRSLLFFLPRRRVTIEFYEPPDLPRSANRNVLNARLEQFYNAGAPPALHVAYQHGLRNPVRPLPDPRWGASEAALGRVPASTRDRVVAQLSTLSGVTSPHDTDRLANDLGLDSLARADLLLWLGHEFGHADIEGDALQTVGDVLLAACGEALATRPTALVPPPRAWLQADPDRRLSVAPGETITAAFLAAARAAPGQIILADQLAGPLTYRDVVTRVLLLQPELARLAGERIGIMLPASVGASVIYLAALFAGKTPLMVNWTTGARNIAHSLDVAGVRHVLTARALLARLANQDLDLAAIRDRIIELESLRERLTWHAKLRAAARARLDWRPLERATPPPTAVILVTSGSESLPKVVPLTHTNILTNIRDVLASVDIRATDRMLGFLPPFHSFGLTATLVTPLVARLPIVYHANPTDGCTLAELIRVYRATIVLGTPTFLNGILRAAGDSARLASLRYAVTGAEKCPDHVFAGFARLCPRATVLEGYGITECSPIVAVNRPEDARPGTIGRLLPSVEHALVNVDTGAPVAPGEAGLLLVRGPSIFPGYLGDDVVSPFVSHAGRDWYRTGDLVSMDAAGILTFRGRLKRFVKIGGEMISLPAIEAALSPHLSQPDDEGPSFAVVALGDESRPELVLCTTRSIARTSANQHVRAAGLSPLHNISRVEHLAEIPLLGNGKTDYRTLVVILTSATDPRGQPTPSG